MGSVLICLSDNLMRLASGTASVKLSWARPHWEWLTVSSANAAKELLVPYFTPVIESLKGFLTNTTEEMRSVQTQSLGMCLPSPNASVSVLWSASDLTTSTILCHCCQILSLSWPVWLAKMSSARLQLSVFSWVSTSPTPLTTLICVAARM